MTAFRRLWKRAPLWRTAFVVGLASAGLTAFFPTSTLKQLAPWLPGASPLAPAASPDAVPPGDAASGNTPGPGTASVGDNQIGLPNPTLTVHGSITIAGHTMPLPLGDWHPILTGRDGPRGEVSQQFFARTSHGVVTGITFVEATQIPIPNDAIADPEAPCHDDRSSLVRLAHIPTSSGPPALECLSTEATTITQSFIANTPFGAQGLERLRTLAFPVPPLAVMVIWSHIIPVPGTSTVRFTAVLTALAPIDPLSTQLIAPMESWDKNRIKSSPIANDFMTRTNRWALLWGALLRRAVEDQLKAGDLSGLARQDPSAFPNP